MVPIPDPEIIVKINQTYRLQFLKDVALARLLDDGTFANLNSVVHYNNLTMVTYFQQNKEYMDTLFSLMASDAPAEKKRDVVFFLKELCIVAKSLPLSQRGHFYR